jgi:hypothetical protein
MMSGIALAMDARQNYQFTIKKNFVILILSQ